MTKPIKEEIPDNNQNNILYESTLKEDDLPLFTQNESTDNDVLKEIPQFVTLTELKPYVEKWHTDSSSYKEESNTASNYSFSTSYNSIYNSNTPLSDMPVYYSNIVINKDGIKHIHKEALEDLHKDDLKSVDMTNPYISIPKAVPKLTIENFYKKLTSEYTGLFNEEDAFKKKSKKEQQKKMKLKQDLKKKPFSDKKMKSYADYIPKTDTDSKGNRCLLINTKENKSFFLKKEYFTSIIALAKKLEFTIVEVELNSNIATDLSKFSKNICNQDYKNPDVEYKAISKLYPLDNSELISKKKI